jgi:hypothetical protein
VNYIPPVRANHDRSLYLGGGLDTHLPGTFLQGLLVGGPVPVLQLYSRISPFGHFPQSETGVDLLPFAGASAKTGAVSDKATNSRASFMNMTRNLCAFCLGQGTGPKVSLAAEWYCVSGG